MTILIIFLSIIFYCIGCILSLGKMTASIYEIEENYIDKLPCDYESLLDFIKTEPWCNLIHLTSWISFLAGVLLYYIDKEKYFFKWSFKPLHQLYPKRNLNETIS